MDTATPPLALDRSVGTDGQVAGQLASLRRLCRPSGALREGVAPWQIAGDPC